MVETALVLVVLVTLAAGVTTVAGTWGPVTSADRLAARTARMVAGVTQGPPSDLDVLALVAAGPDGPNVERLVVYRPAGPLGEPTTACAGLRPQGSAAAGVAGWCTVYGPGHLAALATAGGGSRGCGPGSWEAAWCPTSRRADPATGGWIGVLVELRVGSPALPWGVRRDPLARAQAVVALDPLVEQR